ncbi:MAG TPA: aminodeoxychorismate synthase component I [Candidatus Acidoferrales bacterium]|nr:aminodeoxychorismate synthase component I [Candidatus Acidoferrales bacterium]
MRSLLIDNYDSYTYNLFAQLSVINDCEAVVVRNDVTWNELIGLEFDNIVLSPGPGHPGVESDFGICAEVVRRAQVPVLGVCLGHQGIAFAYGARIAVAREIVHGQSSAIFHDGDGLFAALPQGFLAVRYHSLVVAQPVPEPLRVTAWTSDGTIMGVAVADRPVYGVQFHPESCMTDEGSRVLENFRRLTLERLPQRPVRKTRISAPSRPQHLLQTDGADGAAASVLVQRLSGVYAEPEVVFDAVREGENAVWLDSARRTAGTGRFSYVALAHGTLGHLVRYDHRTQTCTVSSANAAQRFTQTSIFPFLARTIAERSVAVPSGLAFDFCGGYVGWIGYECKADCGIPAVYEAATDDAALLFADRVLVFDHDMREISLVALAESGQEPAARRWFERMSRILRSFERASLGPVPIVAPGAHARPARDEADYIQDVRRAQEQLRAGQSYQVCLTTQFHLDSAPAPFEAYRYLRVHNPAPYAAYLDFGTTQVACASPERFLRSTGGTVEVKPMKGTAARHREPARDAQLAAALSADPKERAENLMIVDLLRNDLSRVCRPGSVRVASLMAVESFERVHQMVSTIRGELPAGATAIDAVRACFPAGSMTGAPKLRACRIIDELELQARGIYSGTIGYFSVNGTAEFNVVIRTLVYHDGEVTLGAGGGITILSDAQREWDEVLLKAQSVLGALGALGARGDAGAALLGRTSGEA